MKVKIFTPDDLGQGYFYYNSQRKPDWLDGQEKSYQDLINDFLDQVKPIQVYVSEDPFIGFLVTTIVYEEKESK